MLTNKKLLEVNFSEEFSDGLLFRTNVWVPHILYHNNNISHRLKTQLNYEMVYVLGYYKHNI